MNSIPSAQVFSSSSSTNAVTLNENWMLRDKINLGNIEEKKTLSTYPQQAVTHIHVPEPTNSRIAPFQVYLVKLLLC